MKTINYIFILLNLLVLSGCAAHQSLDTAQFRHRDFEVKKVALDKDGLSLDQINTIISTKPPKSFPVDIAIVVLETGYFKPETANAFLYSAIEELKKNRKINRLTIIPKFIIPDKIKFNSIQEIGVRSLSEYVLVFHLDSSEIFNWTKIFESQHEAHSSVDFILTDSVTSAMLTSDKLFSKQVYEKNLFDLNESQKAQKQLFSEQGKILAKKIETLFSNSIN